VDEEDEKIRDLYIGDEILDQLVLLFPQNKPKNELSKFDLLFYNIPQLPLDNGAQVILKEDKILISIALAEKKFLKFSYSIKDKELLQITE
jgi:hypothetical protein